MINMRYDVALVIGRFQLPHKAHIEMIMKAGEISNLTLVGIGSSNVKRSLRNTFTFSERAMLIENANPTFKEWVRIGKLKFLPLEDSVYSDNWWVEHVQRKVKQAVIDSCVVDKYKDAQIALVGHKKDNSSYYLDMFPQWTYEPFESKNLISATQVRELYFEEGLDGKTLSTNLALYTTVGVRDALRYIPTQVYEELKTRYNFVKEYKKQWGEGPFYTADAVVIKSGHILLVTRGKEPDKGLWAFPGGFFDKEKDNSPYDAAFRECEEETGLVLWKHGDFDLVNVYGYYNQPNRDDRGQVNTHAYLFDLGNGELPEVKGMDDAAHAEWVPIADLTPQNMAMDHYFIFRDLIRKI